MTTEEKYVKGFNSGYLLAKHEPKLLAAVVRNLHPTTGYIEGLFSGKGEFEREYIKTHSSDLKGIRDQTQNRKPNLERDI